jgi:hypothetical protein
MGQRKTKYACFLCQWKTQSSCYLPKQPHTIPSIIYFTGRPLFELQLALARSSRNLAWLPRAAAGCFNYDAALHGATTQKSQAVVTTCVAGDYLPHLFLYIFCQVRINIRLAWAFVVGAFLRIKSALLSSVY